MSISILNNSEEVEGRFELKFTLAEFLKWLLRPAWRRFRGQRTRFYIRSPMYSRRQVVVDRERSDVITVKVRDTIDVDVIKQVFISEDYGLNRLSRHTEILDWTEGLRRAGKAPLIIDLGANTGLASLYFAREFPTATVVAVEPDPDNALAARRNLAAYANVNVVEGGIAALNGRANILNPGDGNWSYRTELSQTGAIPMYSMSSLVAEHTKPDRIPFIVKIDIEGFESNLFSQNTEWIDLFPVLIIELHDWMLPKSANSGNFLREIGKRNRDFVYFEENVFSISNGVWPVAVPADAFSSRAAESKAAPNESL
jgi:FkbM family methyltransferase